MKVFIGGSRKIAKLNQEIKNRIDNIIKNDFIILIGDANGVDRSIQQYLFSQNYKNVYIFCVNNECRNNVGSWTVKRIQSNHPKKDYKYYSSKDIQMAKETDFGFMIWDGESRGTLNNIINLLMQNKKVLVYFSPEKNFYDIKTFADLNSINLKYRDLSSIMGSNLFPELQ